MVLDISRMRRVEVSDRITAETLVELLKILDNLLRYLSEFVKRAIQAKKMPTGETLAQTLAQQAERLLHVNRPLVACNPFLISLVYLCVIDFTRLT